MFLRIICFLSLFAIAQAAAAAMPPEEARQIAEDAYIYGYSLITTDVTRIQMSNVEKPGKLTAPIGQFIHMKSYPPATYRGVSATNADTLYSVSWIDLKEPQVFSHPEIKGRFFTFELVDLWMIVHASVGTNTAGSKAMTYLFTGPGWSGTVPEGMTQIKFPTRYMVVLGRTYAQGNERDFAKVGKLQEQYKIVPLSSYGRPYTPVAPPIDPNPGFSMTEKPQKVILGFGISDYFNRMTKLMAEIAPPAPEDEQIIKRMAELGIVPGQPFDESKLSPEIRAALKDVPTTALQKMTDAWEQLGKKINGWRVTTRGGRYGTNYLERGAWAALGWPSQLPNVSVYPTTYVDGDGVQLNGKNKYTLTFPAGQMPPVNPMAFWSITMYQIDNGLWFYPNQWNKLTVSPRNKLAYNSDGSLTLYFQHDPPEHDKIENWLPAPDTPFALTMRLYWPNVRAPSILNGTWDPPPVIRTR